MIRLARCFPYWKWYYSIEKCWITTAHLSFLDYFPVKPSIYICVFSISSHEISIFDGDFPFTNGVSGLLCHHVQDVAEALGAALTPGLVHTEGHVLSTFLRVFPGSERSTCRQELILAVSRGAVSFNGVNYPMIFFHGIRFLITTWSIINLKLVKCD